MERKKLPKDICFIQALYKDNPHTAKTYGASLDAIRDVVLRKRLRDGEWEYDDDDAILIDYEKSIEMFSITQDQVQNGEFFLSVDVARFGRDKAVLILWQGLFIRKIWSYDKSSAVFLQEKITSVVNQYCMPFSNVVIDEDGVGGGVVDNLRGVVGFVNGSRPVEEIYEDTQDTRMFNYRNLRSQCYFKLAELINAGQIGITSSLPNEVKNYIVQECESVRRKDVDKNEQSLAVIPKDEMKEICRRSPDFTDAMMMRCYFELGQMTGEVSLEW